MSVTISEYLVANDNKLTALLNDEGLDGTFLDDTLIEVTQRNDVWFCDIFLDYTLSCNDLAAINETFSGYWWCVSPCYVGHPYRLSINLKSDLK